MSSDEWTVVTKPIKHNHSRKKADKLCPGMYHNSNTENIHKSADVSEPKSREHVRNAMVDCLRSLEQQYLSGKGFAYSLINAISKVTSGATDFSAHGGDTRVTNLKEIVVYGIGNFSTNLQSAPMLQLAGAILLRRMFARGITCESRDIDGTDEDALRASFQLEQQQVPIFYYEPCILPLEKEILKEVLCIHVLGSNEKGKLTVSSMRQQIRTTTPQPLDRSEHTLFYMPHCPMRLYCNVLWAHWDHIIASHAVQADEAKNPLIIFGNSFHAYDERTISSEKRKDPTNGMFKLVQFANERLVYIDSENKDLHDHLRMLDRAFNDCNVISISVNKDKALEKPNEYFPSEDPYENGELL